MNRAPVVREVPLSAIETPIGGTSHGVEALAASVRALGLLDSLILAETEEERFRVVAGKRRLGALRLLGCETTTARVYPIGTEPLHLELVAVASNDHRVPVALGERASAVARLVREFDLSPEVLAERLGRSAAWVGRLLVVAQCTGLVREAVDRHLLTNPSSFFYFRSLPEQHQVRLFNEALHHTRPISEGECREAFNKRLRSPHPKDRVLLNLTFSQIQALAELLGVGNVPDTEIKNAVRRKLEKRCESLAAA